MAQAVHGARLAMCIIFGACYAQYPVQHQAQNIQRIVPVTQFRQEQIVIWTGMAFGLLMLEDLPINAHRWIQRHYRRTVVFGHGQCEPQLGVVPCHYFYMLVFKGFEVTGPDE